MKRTYTRSTRQQRSLNRLQRTIRDLLQLIATHTHLPDNTVVAKAKRDLVYSEGGEP